MEGHARLAREAVSPLTRMETQLHPGAPTSSLPVFALANAGVPVSLEQLGDALTSQVGIGILLGRSRGGLDGTLPPEYVAKRRRWQLVRTRAAE